MEGGLWERSPGAKVFVLIDKNYPVMLLLANFLPKTALKNKGGRPRGATA
jgi:hypothetical protein